MGQDFIFADQRRRRDLRHHETGIQACASGEKWRQALTQRGIYQALDSPLADACQRAQCDRQKIQGKRQRLAVEISAGDHVALRILASVIKTSGLSTAELASVSKTLRQCASVSRTAPCTCGMQRNE